MLYTSGQLVSILELTIHIVVSAFRVHVISCHYAIHFNVFAVIKCFASKFSSFDILDNSRETPGG